MSFNEHFIPGKWIDTIDVNDFVNLNKKPFLDDSSFLIQTVRNDISEYFSIIKKAYDRNEFKIHLGFSDFKNQFVHRFDSLNDDINPFIVPVGFSENLDAFKNFYPIDSFGDRESFRQAPIAMFHDIAITDMKKMMQIQLLKNIPANFSATTFHPDIRIVPLYGTRFLIKEKRWLLKSLEKRLKTNEWIQQRIDIQNQISAIEKFEKFAAKHDTDVTKPVSSSKQLLDVLIVSLTYLFLENPSIPFCFDQIISFIDVFLESELEEGLISEEEAQAFVDSFYLQSSLYRFSISPHLASIFNTDMYFFSETFSNFNVCKTSYRFLNSLKRLKLFNYHINLIFDDTQDDELSNSNFYDFFNTIKDDLYTYSFYNPKSFKKNIYLSFDFNAQSYVPSEDLVFDMGSLDLKKLMFLTLNGGKDVVTNSNITPVSQPLRKDDFTYEEFYMKFKDFLIYSVNTFLSMASIVQNLLSRNSTQNLRQSMSYYINFFNPQFSFENLHEVAYILSAIKENAFTVSRNSKRWITDIKPHESVVCDDFVFFDLVELIESEIKKIPQHRMGEISIRFFGANKSDFLSLGDLGNYLTAIPELSKSKFSFNITGSPTIEELMEFSSDGYNSLHITVPNDEVYNYHGMVLKKNKT